MAITYVRCSPGQKLGDFTKPILSIDPSVCSFDIQMPPVTATVCTSCPDDASRRTARREPSDR